jgi:LPS-assembly protein
MKSNTNLDRRIDINNIFNTNRLSFEDTFESGESLTVGLNYNKQKKSKENDIDKISDYIEFKLATVFRNKLEKNIPKKSTLNKKKSNIFGQLNFKPSNVVSFDYDFSITDDMKFLEYSSLNTKIDYKNISTEFNFLEEHGYIGDTNIIENISKFNFNEDNSLSFKTRRNNTINLTEYYDLLYEYKNDCLIAGIKYKKNYYSDSDLKPEEELLFTLSIVPFSSSSD